MLLNTKVCASLQAQNLFFVPLMGQTDTVPNTELPQLEWWRNLSSCDWLSLGDWILLQFWTGEGKKVNLKKVMTYFLFSLTQINKLKTQTRKCIATWFRENDQASCLVLYLFLSVVLFTRSWNRDSLKNEVCKNGNAVLKIPFHTDPHKLLKLLLYHARPIGGFYLFIYI